MSEIVITEPIIIPIKPTQKGLLGFASCVVNNSISLNSIAIYTRPNGDLRLVYPSKILLNGKEINIFYPINRETGEIISAAIIEKYKEIVNVSKT